MDTGSRTRTLRRVENPDIWTGREPCRLNDPAWWVEDILPRDDFTVRKVKLDNRSKARALCSACPRPLLCARKALACPEENSGMWAGVWLPDPLMYRRRQQREDALERLRGMTA